MLPARTRTERPRMATSLRRPGRSRRVRSQSRRRSRSQTPQKVIAAGPDLDDRGEDDQVVGEGADPAPALAEPAAEQQRHRLRRNRKRGRSVARCRATAAGRPHPGSAQPSSQEAEDLARDLLPAVLLQEVSRALDLHLLG